MVAIMVIYNYTLTEFLKLGDRYKWFDEMERMNERSAGY
jgi:hypothetical protein